MKALSLTILIATQVHGQGAKHDVWQPAKPFTLTQVWALGATYTDPVRGVAFRHPSVWKAETEFGYHPGALALSTPIAGFGYEEGGFPRDSVVGPYTKTNLEGFGIVYSAVPVKDSAACDAWASSAANGDDSPSANAGKHRRAVFGGRSFSTYEYVQAGMSQETSGELYATYARGICYLFETDVATASPGSLDDIDALTPAQNRGIDRHLLEIMKSVRIVPTRR
jgi:hypothetical protein